MRLQPNAAGPGGPVPAGVLAVMLVVGAGVVLAASTLGWPGAGVVTVLLAGAAGCALKWASWPRPPR